MPGFLLHVGATVLTARFLTGSTRVQSNGVGLLLLDSQALCAPTGTPLVAVATQTRVSAV